jgi:hypothetical protein
MAAPVREGLMGRGVRRVQVKAVGVRVDFDSGPVLDARPEDRVNVYLIGWSAQQHVARQVAKNRWKARTIRRSVFSHHADTG